MAKIPSTRWRSSSTVRLRRKHLDEFDALIDSLKPRFAHRGDRPLLMVTLLDARHMLVFGNNCLFREVLDSFGIRNARKAR